MMMKHWQFLIQKQGDRSWHNIESTTTSIFEGKYRIVARSGLINTPTEVRVSYVSTSEVLSKRRVQKRSRCTNAEGLIAVIPFTYLKPGIWEIQCSGDIMSDLLGRSWHYEVELQVVNKNLNNITYNAGNNVSNDETSTVVIATSEEQRLDDHTQKQEAGFKEFINPNFSLQLSSEINSSQLDKLDVNEQVEESYNQEKVSDCDTKIDTKDCPEIDSVESTHTVVEQQVESQEDIHQEVAVIAAQSTVNSDDRNSVIRRLSSNKKEQIAIENENIDFSETKQDIKNPENRDYSEILEDTEASEVTNNKTNSEEKSSTLRTKVSQSHVPEELVVVPQSTRAITLQELEQEEYAIIDAPVNPVWLQGESAESILQNLVELALPSSDSLFKEETKDNESINVSPSLPLMLILSAENYISSWGEPLNINGLVKFNETSYYDLGEAYDFDSIFAGELIIELRSPHTSDILKQVKKSLPEKLLPFEFECSAVIPVESESKLILAKISLYGVLSGIGEPELLAEKSFTITAEVRELLAMAKADPFKMITEAGCLRTVSQQMSQKNTSSSLAKESSSNFVTSSPETSASLDLQLFNLVKTAKSSQQSSLLRIDKSPELGNSHLTNSNSAKYSQNPLENLRIQPKKFKSTILPYLKKRPGLSAAKETITKKDEGETSVDKLELENFDNLKTQEAVEVEVHHEKFSLNKKQATNEEQVEKSKADNDFDPVKSPDVSPTQNVTQTSQQDLLEEVTIADNSTLPATNSYPSPLIRKWLESQGHSLPPVENSQYQNYNDTGISVPESETLISTPNPSNNKVHQEIVSENTKTQKNIELENTQLENTQLKDISDSSSKELISSDINSPTPTSASEISETPNKEIVNEIVNYQIQHYSESSWLSHEIVVDDIPTQNSQSDSANASDGNENHEHESFSEENKSSALAIQDSKDLVKLEPLPVPQLYIPSGELVSGRTIRIKVQLEPVSTQVAVKFWVEDTQTRWLLFGPQLLIDLLPNLQGNLETMTQLSIPFGCMEIRLEAIAVDLVTEQESHKVSIMRTVVPPDLPSLQMDEILGI